jgi:hypothetical protein
VGLLSKVCDIMSSQLTLMETVYAVCLPAPHTGGWSDC